MTEGPWVEYIEKTKDKGPRPLLVKALSYVKSKDEALDLGAGALNDTKYLIAEGFKHVTTVDKENLAGDILQTIPSDRISYIVSSFDDFPFVINKFDLVNAQYSLPFNSSDTFLEVFDKIKESLKSGGIFVGQLFGVRDTWNKEETTMTFHTKEEVEKLISDMEIIEFTEEEKDDMPAVGDMKHWHVFHIITRS